MLDELAHAGPEHLDPAFVAGFDRKQGYPDPAEDLDVLREHGIGRAATVVDLGTGTGRFALAAAPLVRRVVAVDVSPAMLAVLRERVAGAGLPNVECVRGGFLSYEHTGAPADAVYTRNALHQLPDFWKALAAGADRERLAARRRAAPSRSDLPTSQPAEAGRRSRAAGLTHAAAPDASRGYIAMIDLRLCTSVRGQHRSRWLARWCDARIRSRGSPRHRRLRPGHLRCYTCVKARSAERSPVEPACRYTVLPSVPCRALSRDWRRMRSTDAYDRASCLAARGPRPLVRRGPLPHGRGPSIPRVTPALPPIADVPVQRLGHGASARSSDWAWPSTAKLQPI